MTSLNSLLLERRVHHVSSAITVTTGHATAQLHAWQELYNFTAAQSLFYAPGWPVMHASAAARHIST